MRRCWRSRVRRSRRRSNELQGRVLNTLEGGPVGPALFLLPGLVTSVTMSPRTALISLVRYVREKRVHLHRPRDAPLKIHTHARVRILPIVAAQSVSYALTEGIPIGAPALNLIANAPVEIFLLVPRGPEWDVALNQYVVDQFRNRPMDLPHHRAEFLTHVQIPQRVVVIIQQRSDPRHKPVLSRVMLETIPEDLLRLFRFEGEKSVATARGDEVDGIVTVPMLEPMFPVVRRVSSV